MSFKIHLIIVSFIIAVVYLTWHLLSSAPPVTTTAPSEPPSPYSVSISHASWGLNCRSRAVIQSGGDEGFAKNTNTQIAALHSDNVLEALSAYCSGKTRCDILASSEILGRDPFPECREKELDVEYRCFSFDRPWRTKSTSGSLSINCNKSN